MRNTACPDLTRRLMRVSPVISHGQHARSRPSGGLRLSASARAKASSQCRSRGRRRASQRRSDGCRRDCRSADSSAAKNVSSPAHSAICTSTLRTGGIRPSTPSPSSQCARTAHLDRVQRRRLPSLPSQRCMPAASCRIHNPSIRPAVVHETDPPCSAACSIPSSVRAPAYTPRRTRRISPAFEARASSRVVTPRARNSPVRAMWPTAARAAAAEMNVTHRASGSVRSRAPGKHGPRGESVSHPNCAE